MFKWGHPIQEGTDLFSRTVVAPPVLRVRVQQPPANPNYDTSKESISTLAQKILDRERANVIQWGVAQRQNAQVSGLQHAKTRREFFGLVAVYTFAGGREQLDVVVHPAPIVKKPDVDLQLLILHDTNKVTTVSMKSLDIHDETKAMIATYRQTLKQGSWGEELIKSSQYRFSTELGTVLFSPITITDHVTAKAEKHHFCAMSSKMTHFVESSTLAARTPRINGVGVTVYAPNDVFGLERSGSGFKLVRTGDGGNGAFPYAITADGTYYYGPASFSPSMKFYSVDPFEHHANTTVLSTNNVTFLEVTDALFDQPAAYHGDQGFNIPLFVSPAIPAATMVSSWISYDVSQYLVGNEGEYLGYTGYSTYTNGVYHATYVRTDQVIVVTPTFNPNPPFQHISSTYYTEFINTDFSQSLPVTVFSQSDALDVVEVVMTPVTARYHLDYNLPGHPAGTTVQSWRFSFLHYASGEDTAIGGVLVLRTPPDLTLDQRFTIRLVSYPPSFGLADGDYYFFDTYTLRTPYGQTVVDASAIETGSPATRFWGGGKYTPWVHLSNGKVMVQGFELLGERHVYLRGPKIGDQFPTPVEITAALAAAAKTDIANIQALIIDVPLARARELV